MRRPRTLRGRLAAWYAAVLALTLVAFAATVYFVVVDEEEEPAAIGEPREEPDHVGARLLVALAVALPGALALAVGGGLWITRRSLAPLGEVARVAGELGAERLDRRVDLPDGAADELRQLAGAFNAMLARLETSVDGMRRFTADASHELRTPLAALRGEIEVTLRRPRAADEMRVVLETSLEQIERLSQLLEALLTLARSDAGELPLRRARHDLVELTRRVVAPFEPLAADRKLTLRVDGAASVTAEVDELWLGRAIANLVDNAVKLTPAGGEVLLTVEARADRACITVRDSGPGFDPEEGAQLFRRFFRGRRHRASTPGFGLGLALSRDVIRAQGGELSARPPSGGGGAELVIDLPLVKIS